MSTPDREFCLQIEHTFEKEQHTANTLKINTLKESTNAYVAIYAYTANTMVGLLEAVETPEETVNQEPYIKLIVAKLEDATDEIMIPIIEIMSFDLIPNKMLIEHIFFEHRYHLIVTKDGQKHIGYGPTIYKNGIHQIKFFDHETDKRRTIPLKDIFKFELARNDYLKKKIQQNQDKIFIVTYTYKEKTQKHRGWLIHHDEHKIMLSRNELYKNVTIRLEEINKLEFEDSRNATSIHQRR